jgi:uncharacterized protein
MSLQQSTPINSYERSDILDVLRGFAILGIFLDNVFGFTGYGFFTMAQREALPTFYADGILGISELAFVHGKFYSMFSLLFGIGFSIILTRNEEKGINPLKIFYRRLFILLLIGAGHIFLLWEGDILLLYALVGFILPLFRKCSDKALLIWTAALIASPILIDLIKVSLNIHIAGSLENLAQSIDKKTGLPTDENFSKYLFKEGSGWKEWRNWQASGWIYRYSYLVESNRIPKVLGMFLLGFYAGRKKIYSNLEQYDSLFKKLRRWGFIIGIPTSIAMAIFEIDGKSVPKAMGLLDTFFYAVSVVPLSLAYVSSICLFWTKTKGNNKWKILAPVGRMALTNYLMQTILGITIFYGVGFGLGGNIGPAVFFPIALAVYIVQIIYSNWWFKYFNYGPVEWIWRQLTYGKRLPIRK